MASNLFHAQLDFSEDPSFFFDDDYITFDYIRTTETDQNQHQLADDQASTGFLSSLPLLNDNVVKEMVGAQAKFLPRDDYVYKLNHNFSMFNTRAAAVSWIIWAFRKGNLGPLCVCLAINYLDRFLSLIQLPEIHNWSAQLVAILCSNLAAKLEEGRIPREDFQVGPQRINKKTIRKCELKVLETLEWKMHVVTPFCFIDYFLSVINLKKYPIAPMISRSMELILNTVQDIRFLQFKPSEISAAVAVQVVGETRPVNILRTVNYFRHVNNYRVLDCLKTLKGVIKNANGALNTPLIAQQPTPIRTFDAIDNK